MFGDTRKLVLCVIKTEKRFYFSTRLINFQLVFVCRQKLYFYCSWEHVIRV